MRGRVGKGRRQPDHWFEWDRRGGLQGWDVECIFKKYGVPVIGRRYAAQSPTVGVKVPGSQAKFAEYLLCRAGVGMALVTPLLNPRHAQTKIGPLPPAWGKPAKTRGVMGWFVRILATMFVGGDTAKGLKTASTKKARR
jgi:hypothetical protein